MVVLRPAPPARPLFLGRKPCLPAARLFAGFVEAEGAREALEALPLDPLLTKPDTDARLRAAWPAEEGGGDHVVETAEARNWRAGLPALAGMAPQRRGRDLTPELPPRRGSCSG
jgi:CRISPR system Cascade subunit CasD